MPQWGDRVDEQMLINLSLLRCSDPYMNVSDVVGGVQNPEKSTVLTSFDASF
jgi:hypothetical protein